MKKSKYEFEKHAQYGAEQLYLLSWFDSIDRLDTLLLEARHLQLNIIYNLREPRLYIPLRYEEVGLWGSYIDRGGNKSSWESYFNKTKREYDHLLTEEIIISYPSPPKQRSHAQEKEPEKYSSHETHHKEIVGKLRSAIDSLWVDNNWGKDQKQAYFSLLGIQLLKREILLDKLILCRHAYQESKLYENSTFSETEKKRRSAKAQFMILRGAIMHKATDEYLSRLTDYHRQLGQISDIDSDGLPKSSIERRREIYLYGHYLNERTLAIQADMKELAIDFFSKTKTNKQDKVKRSWKNLFSEKQTTSTKWERSLPTTGNTLFTHNWKQSHKSTSWDYKAISSSKSIKRLTHISTHFWMPERPDLQPIIAHEVAHTFVRTIYDDLKRSKLSALDDDFSYLLLRIQYAIDKFGSYRPHELGLDPVTITREVACDFMAGTLKGFSYLYAFFIDYVGQHFSFSGLLHAGRNKIDIERLHLSKAGRIGDSLYDSREWYFRTRVLLEWIKAIHHRELSYLEKDMLLGIRHVIDDILEYYIVIAANDEQANDERMWRDLSDHICKIIKYQKPCKQAKKWRSERSSSKYTDDGKEGNGRFSRHAKRLDTRVRDHLFRMQINLKLQDTRSLGDYVNSTPPNKREDNIDLIFNNFYISQDEKLHQRLLHVNEDKQVAGKGPLYKHVYDIPWQCALMRSKDILWKIDSKESTKNNLKIKSRKNEFNKVMSIMHDKFSLGRDLFSYALEFYLYETQSPKDRLTDIQSFFSSCDAKRKEITADEIKLSSIYHTKVEIEESGKIINKKLIYIIKDALLTDEGGGNNRTNNPHYNKKIGHALRIIQSKLKGKSGSLKSLYNYIKSHDKGTSGNIDFHEYITKSFSSYNLDYKKTNAYLSIHNNDIESEKDLYKMYLIGRGAIAGSYSSAKEESTCNIIHKHKFHSTEKTSWHYDWSPDNKDYKPKYDIYYKTLGRHDLFSISRTNLLCHCPLPILDIEFKEKSSDTNKDLSIYSNINHEKFPIFSTRKELALPIRLNIKKDDKWPFRASENAPSEIFSSIFITLKQPAFRLPFIYRLLTTIESGNNKSPNESCLEDIGHHFRKFDCAFLTDGKSDLVILLMTTDNAKKEHDLNRTFIIQNALYEDFMVGRTSMVFMASALNTIDKKSKNYKVVTKLRMMEDRGLDYSNNVKSYQKIDNIYKTAGQYDFEFDPQKTDGFDTINEVIKESLKGNKHLDRIETIIQKKWKYDDQLSKYTIVFSKKD